MNKEKIWIIWAGPAWIFLSLLLKNWNKKNKNLEIHLFEENHQVWKKLKLTWNWKMNITNKNFWVDYFFSNNERILKNFFKNNLTKNPEKIFDEIWIEYFWKWNRAILKNENAKEEVENLEKIIKNSQNIFLHKWEKISEIKKNISEKWLEKFEINLNNKLEIFDKIILATWWVLQIWKTWKEWNKKSEIYSIPEKLWHTITKTEPSLSPIIIRENPFSELSGSAFFWKISDLENPKNQIIWDILFTHKWLSWPAILDFTANEISKNCEINFFPNLKNNQNLENIFLEEFIKNKEISEKSKQKISDFIKNFNSEKKSENKNILPKKIINFILEQKKFSPDQKISDISKKNFLEIRKNFFHLKINNCQKMAYQFCRTTKWWINLKEININSLESRLHKNLFFAWEILDINWLCWWYNISFAAICAKIISEKICK